MNHLLALLFLVSVPLSATEILPEHSGQFLCQCQNEVCKDKKNPEIQLDTVRDRLVINHGEEIHSGAPARTRFKDGETRYSLASGANLSFSKENEMLFGWGKIWSCRRIARANQAAAAPTY